MNHKLIYSFIILFFVLCGQLFIGCAQNLREVHIVYNKLRRSYYIHIPSSKKPNDGYPLIIFLHGYGGNGKNGLAQGYWIQESDKENFILAGLNGVLKYPDRRESFLFNPRSWNCGGEGTPAEVNKINDVGFIDTVITIIESRYKVDSSMVYITGFSNGAAMTFTAGMELSGRIAAIAPVSSVLLIKPKPLLKPVSLLLIYGTNDPVNPFNGGMIERFGKEWNRPSAKDCWKEWGDMLKCSQKVTVLYDTNGVQGEELGPDSLGASAQFYTIEGMGHNWPGGKSYLPEAIVGKTSNRINATDLIWKFFKSHPKIKESI
jgi:polyhydroxybutyrate depolymerase